MVVYLYTRSMYAHGRVMLGATRPPTVLHLPRQFLIHADLGGSFPPARSHPYILDPLVWVYYPSAPQALATSSITGTSLLLSMNLLITRDPLTLLFIFYLYLLCVACIVYSVAIVVAVPLVQPPRGVPLRAADIMEY